MSGSFKALAALAARLEALAGWLMPGHCLFCLAAIEGRALCCDRCRFDLPLNHHPCRRCAEPLPESADGRLECGRCVITPPQFDEAFVPFLYGGGIAELVQRFKYGADRRAAEVLYGLVCERLLEEMARRRSAGALPPEALVVASLHEERARQRGFDQSLWLGRRLSAALGCRLVPAHRLRVGDVQHRLSRAERFRNLRHAYRVDVALPQRVLLFDDVMTTGATLEALANACRRAGAWHCTALAAARTPADRMI
ncbi:ComF family protein [Kushneria aurantia]|uniref:ComF family protein n=1 Tax=Kushneria aurantia TaxID=504092 RepID=A0ABV6G6G3_9GAMM|nr:ComF family protein [Kushneria aurantia]